jgi:hypothetical protein
MQCSRVLLFMATILVFFLLGLQAQQAPINCKGPLTEEQLIGLLAAKVDDARVQAIVTQCGVGFRLTLEVERRLHAAGASDAVIAVAGARAPKPPGKPPSKSDDAAREQKLWEGARDGKSAERLEDYLRQFPEGQHASEARDKLSKLTKAEELRGKIRQAKEEGQWQESEGRLKELEALTPEDEEMRTWKNWVSEERAHWDSMTLMEASGKMTSLQGKVDQIRKTVEAERDQALQQVEEKYRVERAKLAQKDPSETPAEFEKRKADLEFRYKAEREGAEKRYTGELEEKARSYTSQISYLNRRTYLIEGTSPEFVGYDADTNRLTAKVYGEEYWFQIKGEAARSLVGGWRTVKVEQYLGEERSQERVLMDPATGARFDGILRVAEEERIRREIELTQHQLIDVKETLPVAVAKNVSELDALRRKGERYYYEFSIPTKSQVIKVGDIQIILKSTDVKKGKFTIDILVDNNKIEKKDANVNEPLQFLVGKNRLRYELVVNWVQKDKAAGYLSIPK